LNPLNLFKKSDPEMMEFGRNIAYGENNKSLSATEFENQMGVNHELIHDKEFEGFLKTISWNYGPVINEDGKIEKWAIVGPNFDGMALRSMLSNLTRVAYIEKGDAVLYKMYAERVIRRMKMNTPEYAVDIGRNNFFDSLLILVCQAIDDSVKGRKAILLKIVHKMTSVNVSQGKANMGEM
jgi:hypothetical protein